MSLYCSDSGLGATRERIAAPSGGATPTQRSPDCTRVSKATLKPSWSTKKRRLRSWSRTMTLTQCKRKCGDWRCGEGTVPMGGIIVRNARETECRWPAQPGFSAGKTSATEQTWLCHGSHCLCRRWACAKMGDDEGL